MRRIGRPSIIQDAIIEVLENSEPLRPKAIKEKIERLKGRTFFRSAISAALNSLASKDLIEKKLYNGKICYIISNQSHKQTIKSFVERLVDNFDLQKLEANFSWGKEQLPNVVYASPEIPSEYDVADKSELKMGVGVEWKNSSEAISSVICNDYLLLPSNIREGIAYLILWSYWVAVQDKKKSHKFEGVEIPSSITTLARTVKYTTEIATWAKDNGDKPRLEAEQATIGILNTTLELLKKENLESFLQFSNENRDSVRIAQEKILSVHRHFLAHGEQSFDEIIKSKNEMVFNGFASLEDIPHSKFKMFFKDENLSADQEVWQGFINFIFETNSEKLFEISGDFEKASSESMKYSRFIEDLGALFKGRQIIAIYFWNTPVKMEREKCLKLPEFEEWRKALDSGDLSHRVWLFEEETIKKVEKAYRAVKAGRIPLAVKIDKEFWTLKDVYNIHPKGHDPEFWHSLIQSLKAQSGKDAYRGGPVPRNVCYELIKKQREAAKEFMERKTDE